MSTTPGHLITDTHVHVFDPVRFPYCDERTYTPGPATVDALSGQHASLGVRRVVVVQPSVYGANNACLLDALARLGQDQARGIAVAEAGRVSRSELQQLHRGGVRGLRLNLEVRHEVHPDRIVSQLRQAASTVDLEGWCVQVHCARTVLPVIEEVLHAFRVPVVLDHFGGLLAGDALQGSGPLQPLLRLLGSGRVYVKLSAFYRASREAPHYADLAPLARALIAARPDRLLWGSDWPHTGGGTGARDAAQIEPFRSVDLGASLAALESWCEGSGALNRILIDNPAELYGFGPLHNPSLTPTR